MSASTITLRSASFARPFPTVRGVLDRLAAADARYRDRTNLRSVDDRLLRDMGVTRADVEAELRRRIW
jgi:uncharacterized protein YjiS (DUF1127 family)